jgi:hypothetical protein
MELTEQLASSGMWPSHLAVQVAITKQLPELYVESVEEAITTPTTQLWQSPGGFFQRQVVLEASSPIPLEGQLTPTEVSLRFLETEAMLVNAAFSAAGQTEEEATSPVQLMRQQAAAESLPEQLPGEVTLPEQLVSAGLSPRQPPWEALSPEQLPGQLPEPEALPPEQLPGQLSESGVLQRQLPREAVSPEKLAEQLAPVGFSSGQLAVELLLLQSQSNISSLSSDTCDNISVGSLSELSAYDLSQAEQGNSQHVTSLRNIVAVQTISPASPQNRAPGLWGLNSNNVPQPLPWTYQQGGKKTEGPGRSESKIDSSRGSHQPSSLNWRPQLGRSTKSARNVTVISLMDNKTPQTNEERKPANDFHTRYRRILQTGEPDVNAPQGLLPGTPTY